MIYQFANSVAVFKFKSNQGLVNYTICDLKKFLPAIFIAEFKFNSLKLKVCLNIALKN